jgi:hypothetical protein
MLAIGYLGDGAAMTPAEVMILQSSLSQALSNTPPAALERVAVWVWPAGLVIGSVMYAVRLGKLAASRIETPPPPPPAPPPPDKPADYNNGQEQAWTAPAKLDSRGFRTSI